jgi:GDP-L-fucose synthase
MDLTGASVVLTGGTGFLGSHLATELEAHGAHVAALGRADYDLRDRSSIDCMLADLQPRAVIHLAAVVGGIGANLAEPGRFFYENARMGIELVEACRVAEIEKVVLSGTVCAYPKVVPLPFREENLWDGYPEETNAPYGLAKRMLLVQAQSYRVQYGSNIVYLLPVNLYGPGDNFDLEKSHVVPGMIRRFIEARDHGHRSVRLWGDGSPTREFLHVRDASRAFRLALEKYDDPDPVNIGSGEEIAIRELAAIVSDVVGFGGKIEWDPSRPNGQPRRKLDTTRAAELLGFVASIPFKTGILETTAWYEDQVVQARHKPSTT